MGNIILSGNSIRGLLLASYLGKAFRKDLIQLNLNFSNCPFLRYRTSADYLDYPFNWIAQLRGRYSTKSARIVRTGKRRVKRNVDCRVVTSGDSWINSAYPLRFALFLDKEVGNLRFGWAVQPICELETYKSISIIGFSEVEGISNEITRIDAEINQLISNMTSTKISAETRLDALSSVFAELEIQSTKSSFWFAATKA